MKRILCVMVLHSALFLSLAAAAAAPPPTQDLYQVSCLNATLSSRQFHRGWLHSSDRVQPALWCFARDLDTNQVAHAKTR